MTSTITMLDICFNLNPTIPGKLLQCTYFPDLIMTCSCTSLASYTVDQQQNLQVKFQIGILKKVESPQH